MEVTYTKLQLDAAGQTELLEQTSDQTMMAKQGETSFVIHGQDGKASTAVDQKWHMISAEQVGDSGSVIWQHAETGTFRQTKYSIDNTQKTWTQSGEAQELNTSELYAREGEHKADLNGDGFQSSSALSLKGPGNQQQGSSEIMLEGDGLISSTNKVVGQWKADRNTEYSIEGKDKGLFKVDNTGKVEFKGDAFSPDPSKAKEPTAYEFTIKATDKSTNQSVTQTVKLQQRHIIEVTSNAGDTSKGSFGWAVQQANQLGAKNIASEIRFKESMTIESKNGYHLTHGDVKINTYDSKNISIKRTTNGSAFTIGEKQFATKNSSNDQPNLKVDASNINVYGTEAKGGDAAANGGGGGGMGTGAGILHFNGHVVWSNSVFQGNKVVGGEGAEGPKAGAKSYFKWEESPWWSGGEGYHRYNFAKNGADGLRGGGMNGDAHSFGNQTVNGGTRAYGAKGSNHGSNGSNAPDAKGLGEGGNGPGAGGGPDYKYPRARGSNGPMGNPGKYGVKGKATYGGGEAVGPGDGTAAWGGKADKNRGGRGSAVGAAISSFAQKNEKNSFTVRNTDALNNKAESSASAGKIKNIHSRHIDIKIDNYRQSDQVVEDRNRTAVSTGKQNNDPSIDRKQAYNNSAQFIKAEAKDPTGITVRANSYVVKATEANAVGQTIKLDPNKSHAIFSGMEMNTKDIAALEVNGWQQWRNGIMSMAGKVYATKTEAEIRASKKGFFDTWGGLGIKYAGKLPSMGYLGDGVNVVKGIISEFAEEKRIQKELKNREATIAKHNKIKQQFQGGLTIDRFQITDIRTQPRLDGFSLGKHTNDFQPGIDPVLTWQGIHQGRAFISIAHRDLANKTDDSKAKKFQTIVLTKEQTEEMKNIIDINKYLNSFVQYEETKVGDQIFRHARIGTQSEWGVKKNTDPKHDPLTGAGNDRIVIQRDYGSSASINDNTNLTVYTHQGDDIIQGDKGKSSIYAGRGNDSITPGLGVDYVDGGEGRDIVNYRNVSQALKAKAHANGTVKVKFANAKEEGTMDDTITGVESFVFKENAVIDFKGATRPVEYSANDPKRITNKESHYAFSLKGNTSFEGSDYDDKVSINFSVKEGASGTVDSIKKVSIDGRGGRNTVVINGLDSYIDNGHIVSIDRTKKEVNLIKGDSKKTIVGYQNVMGDPIVITKDNQVIEPELNPSKPAVEEVKKVDPSVSPLTQSDAETTTVSTSADQPMMVDSLTGNTVESANNVTGTAPQLKAGTDSLTGETMTNADADSSDWTPMHQDAGLSEGSVNHSRDLLAAHSNGINSNNEFNTHPETLSVLEVDPIATSIAGQPVISDPFEALGANATYRSTSTPAGVIEMV